MGLVPLVLEVLEERREVVSLAFATVLATAASTADFAAIADSRFSRPSRSRFAEDSRSFRLLSSPSPKLAPPRIELEEPRFCSPVSRDDIIVPALTRHFLPVLRPRVVLALWRLDPSASG